MIGLRKLGFWICIFVCAALLTAGFGISGRWVGAIFPAAAAACWILFRKMDPFWPPSLAFLIYLGGAGYGLISGVAPFLLLSGAGAALAAWDLALFNSGQPSTAQQDPQQDRWVRQHLLFLAAAVGLGLLLAGIGLSLRVNLPFGIILGTGLGVVLSLIGAARWFSKKSE